MSICFTKTQIDMQETCSLGVCFFFFLFFFICPFDFCQSELVEGEEHEHSITSKINLVDLAGSERCNSAMTSGERLRVRAPYRQNTLAGKDVLSFNSCRD